MELNTIYKYYFAPILTAFTIAAIYGIVVLILANSNSTDFTAHAHFAKNILQSKGTAPPHFIFHIVLICAHKVTGISMLGASSIAISIFVFVGSLVAFAGLKNRENSMSPWFIGLATGLLFFSHPIPLTYPFDQTFYFGYISTNVFHNPTIIALKTVALIQFVFLSKLLSKNQFEPTGYMSIIVLAFLTILTVLTKASYIIILIPALVAVYVLKQLRRNRDDSWLVLLSVGVFVPALLLLLWQHGVFRSDNSEFGIEFSAFRVFQFRADLWTLFPKLLSSVVLPLSMCLVIGSSILKKVDFQLSFWMFIISLFYAYFLVETGPRMTHGNLWWSSQISSFLLLFVCAKYYIGFIFNSAKKSFKICVPAYIAAAQLVCGILWVYLNIAG
jgi:hypothetical protein